MVALVVPALGSHGQENPCDSLASQACLICELHVLVRDSVSETKIGISKELTSGLHMHAIVTHMHKSQGLFSENKALLCLD